MEEGKTERNLPNLHLNLVFLKQYQETYRHYILKWRPCVGKVQFFWFTVRHNTVKQQELWIVVNILLIHSQAFKFCLCRVLYFSVGAWFLQVDLRVWKDFVKDGACTDSLKIQGSYFYCVSDIITCAHYGLYNGKSLPCKNEPWECSGLQTSDSWNGNNSKLTAS